MFQVIIDRFRERFAFLSNPRLGSEERLAMFPKPVFKATAARFVLWPLLAACAAACGSSPVQDSPKSSPPATPAAASASATTIPIVSATIVHTYPHDPHAFTQGLEFYEGKLYESTGRTGQSSLRECVLATGKVLRSVKLPAQEFGEGLTIFRGKIYQLTWLSKKGFIYDVRTFKKIGEFPYASEGWGLTHDDASLILSDGTNRLQFLDPATFAVTKTLEVYAGNEAVTNLNELEYIHGEIFANIWHSTRIARIDPRTGQVSGWIELAPLSEKENLGGEDVLNGIAYDEKSQRLVVTGKNWPNVFEIKLEESHP
jgi:glutaminyl-peptide cyclotransferase